MKKLNVLFLSHGFRDDTGYRVFLRKWFSLYCGINSTFVDLEELYKNHTTRQIGDIIDSVVKSRGIDVIWLFSRYGFDISLYLIERFNKKFWVLFNFDDELLYEEALKYYASLFDAVITTDLMAFYKYRNLGIPAYFFISCFDSSAAPGESLPKIYNVSFVGNIFKGDRLKYILFLKERGIDVEVFGLKRDGTFLKYKDMLKCFNQSKINLNFTKVAGDKYKFFIKDDFTNNYRQIKGRIIEIAMSGGFCLTEYVGGLEDVFRLGKEIDSFECEQECLDKVRFYLRHEALRERMARAAAERARKFYDFRVIVPRTVEFIEDVYRNFGVKGCSRFDEKENFITDYFKKKYLAFRFNNIVLKSSSLLKAVEELSLELKYGKVSAHILSYAINLRRSYGKLPADVELLYRKLKKYD